MKIIYNFALLLLFQCFSFCDQAVKWPQSSPLTDSVQMQKSDKAEVANIVFKSTDGGQTWQDISEGVPEPVKDKYGVGRNGALKYPYNVDMQDWQYEVAELSDIEKYFSKYTSTNDDDVRFLLMEMIIETSNEHSGCDWIVEIWPRVQLLLRENFALHEYTVFRWSCFNDENIQDCFYITACMRALWIELSEDC